MQSTEYNGDYFKKTRNNVGLLLKSMRPVWWRWVRIIGKYKHDGSLLDIGCGEGYFLQYAERYYNTYGMDVSDYCISEAGRKTNRTRFSIGSIAQLDYGNETFDIITCFDVLEHLKEPEAAIKECRRVLKSGGIFVVRVPNIFSLGCKWKKDEWFAYKDKTHISMLSNEEWFALLSRNNFKVLDIFYDGLWDTPYLKYVPRIFQDLFIKFLSLGLFLLGMKFSRKYGENLCMIACRRE